MSKDWGDALADGSFRKALRSTRSRKGAPTPEMPRYGQKFPKPDAAERMKLRKSWGKQLREAREKMKLTQAELARVLGIPQSRLHSAELGGGSLNSFLGIANGLGFDFVLTARTKMSLQCEYCERPRPPGPHPKCPSPNSLRGLCSFVYVEKGISSTP